MNVLSLFDGMSCGQIALNRLGYTIDHYYAAEIDKYAIQVTQANFPNTIQIGDVTKVRGADLPQIDLIIGGSPCQGFSFAGKQLNFDDPRSALFFEFVRLVRECKPKYFFLENVKMKKEYQDVISEYMGVEPVELNSALVSAQNRKRLYWTNIPGYVEPEDKGILLKDIIEDGKAPTFTTNKGEGSKIGRVNDNPRVKAISENERGYRPHRNDQSKTGISELGRILKPDSKTDTLLLNHAPKVALNNDKSDLVYRKLTPLECERLQTVPDNYTNHVSNSQRYRMLGNGWTVDAVCEFFKHIEQDI